MRTTSAPQLCQLTKNSKAKIRRLALQVHTNIAHYIVTATSGGVAEGVPLVVFTATDHFLEAHFQKSRLP